jgi:hypothetical protein
MGALSFASRVAPGAGAFQLSRTSRRRRVAVNVRKSPVAALNAKAETRWTDPPPFPEVRRSSLSVVSSLARQPPNVRREKTLCATCLSSHDFPETYFSRRTESANPSRRSSFPPPPLTYPYLSLAAICLLARRERKHKRKRKRKVSARFETATRRLRAPARDAAAAAPPPKRKRDAFFRLAKFVLAGSAVLGASLLMPRAALARGANPVATVAFAKAKKETPQTKDGKKAFSSTAAKGAPRDVHPLLYPTKAPPSADALVALARRAVPVAAALAAAYAVYATRAFYEKALERSVKTLKSCLNETAALRLELDATRAELDDALRARDTLAFQLGQSSAEVRSDLQKAVLELAKTETDLECTRRELADAAAIARRESDDHKKDIERLEKRNATRVEELEQTIRGLESEVFALNVRLDAVRAVFTKPQTSPPEAFALSAESGDDAATREEKEGGFVAVKEAPSETSVISADLEISDREVVDGVVVERDASRDAGAKTSHPR